MLLVRAHACRSQCVLGSVAICLAMCRATLTTGRACRQLEQVACAVRVLHSILILTGREQWLAPVMELE